MLKYINCRTATKSRVSKCKGYNLANLDIKNSFPLTTLLDIVSLYFQKKIKPLTQ